MITVFKVCLFAALVLQGKAFDHAIYLSTAEIATKEGKVSVAVKVFSDDLMDAIRNFSSSDTPINEESLSAEHLRTLEDYFEVNLIMEIGDEQLPLALTTREVVGDTNILSFHCNHSPDVKKVTITATYLTELFPDQINVISMKFEGQNQFARLSKSKPSTTFTFD